MSFFNIYTCRIYHNIFCIFYEYFNDWYFLLLRGEYIYIFVRTSYEPYIIHVYTEIGLFGSYFDTHIANFLRFV